MLVRWSVVALFVSIAGLCAVACSDDDAAPQPPAGFEGGPQPDGAVETDAEAGADAAAPSAVAWTSGTRLRARVSSAGTSRLFVGWHDAMLDIDCAYAVANDGKMRCVPGFGPASTFYDEPTCKTAVGVIQKPAATPKYLPAPSGPFVCGTGSDFFLPGAAYAPAALYQVDDTGSCVSAGAPDGAAFAYVHVGARVDPATFVAATEAFDPRGARLAARQYVGEDGSRQDVDMRDSARADSRCAAQDVRDGTYWCVPTDLAYQETHFSDPGCTALIGFHPGYAQQVCNRTPSAIQDSTNASIGKKLSFFEVGAKVTGTVYRDEGACAPYVAPASLGATYYATGAPLPLTALASLSLKNEGMGRILVSTARTESGALASSIEFYDSKHSVPCTALKAADGQTRCLPRTRANINQYVDDQCTQAVLQRPLGAPPTAPGTFALGAGAMLDSSAVYQIAAEIAVPVTVWGFNGTTCQVTGMSATDKYYGTSPVPPSDFAVVTTAAE